jgi:hypothetical protein
VTLVEMKEIEDPVDCYPAKRCAVQQLPTGAIEADLKRGWELNTVPLTP